MTVVSYSWCDLLPRRRFQLTDQPCEPDHPAIYSRFPPVVSKSPTGRSPVVTALCNQLTRSAACEEDGRGAVIGRGHHPGGRPSRRARPDVHDRLAAVAGVAVTMASADGEPTTVGASTELARTRPGPVRHRVRTLPSALRGDGGAYVPDLAVERWGRTGRRRPASVCGVACLFRWSTRGRWRWWPRSMPPRSTGPSPLQRQLAVELAGKIAGSIGLARTLAAQAYELDDRTSAMD